VQTKTEFMQAVFAGFAAETMTFVPDDGTPTRVYNVTELRKRLYTPFHIPKIAGERIAVMTSDIAPYLRENRVWDEERVRNLKPTDLEDPPIALRQPDGSMVFVDGTHRALRRERDGEETMEIMVVDDHLAPRIDPVFSSLLNEGWGEPLDSLRKRRGL
jgi:hypothetical protein